MSLRRQIMEQTGLIKKSFLLAAFVWVFLLLLHWITMRSVYCINSMLSIASWFHMMYLYLTCCKTHLLARFVENEPIRPRFKLALRARHFFSHVDKTRSVFREHTGTEPFRMAIKQSMDWIRFPLCVL